MRRAFWRLVVRALRSLALIAVILLLALYAALRTPALRSALFELAADAVETSTGIRLTARDVSLAPVAGRIVIDELELSAPSIDARPFLTVRRTRAVVSWSSLLRQRVVVRSLRLARPRFDLGSPLPEIPATAAAEDSESSRSLDVHEIEVTGAAVVSGPLPDGLEMWLDSFRIEQAELRGSYRSDELRLQLPAARLTVESSRRPSILADARASLVVDADGSFAVESLEIDGDGLELRTTGRARLAARGPLTFAFELAAAPPRLFPDLTSGGQLDAGGDIALADRVVASDIRLDVRDLPGELLTPGLALSNVGGLDLTGTDLDVDAELRIEIALARRGGDPIDRLAGHASLVWSNEIERLATASLTALDEPAGIGFAFQAAVLPDEAGRRQLDGELHAPSWLELTGGELRRTRLDFTVPDLATAARRLGVQAGADGFQPLGELRATGDAEGSLMSPDLRLATRWQLDGEPLLTAELRSIDGVGPGKALHLEIAAAIFPGTPGRRELAGRLLAADAAELIARELQGARLRDARLVLEIPDLDGAVQDLRRYWRLFYPDRELPAALAEDSASGDLFAGELTVTAAGSGPLGSPLIELEAAWQPSGGERVRLVTRGAAAMESPYFQGQATARLDVADLDLARFAAGNVTGRITCSFDFAGSPEAHRATLVLDGAELTFGDSLGFHRLELAALSNGNVVTLSRLDGLMTSGQPLSGSRPIRARSSARTGAVARRPARDRAAAPGRRARHDRAHRRLLATRGRHRGRRSRFPAAGSTAAAGRCRSAAAGGARDAARAGGGTRCAADRPRPGRDPDRSRGSRACALPAAPRSR